MLLGIGKATITPPIGTPMAGFASRDHGSEAVRDDLEVRTLWFQSAQNPAIVACIVTADIISFRANLTAELRQAAQARFDLPPECLMLSASHTHSGPQIGENMLAGGDWAPDVASFVRDQVFDTIVEARKQLSPVTLRAGRGACEGYAINRRLPGKNGCEFEPNPEGARDDEVIVLSFHDADGGALRAALFHFTCHPTLMGDYALSGDYPGAARRVIEAASGGVAAFLPGCFGDVRPNCYTEKADGTGRQFRRGEEADLAAFGSALGQEVLHVIRGSAEYETSRLRCRSAEVELPYSKAPLSSVLQELSRTGTALEKKWAAHLLETGIPPPRTLSLQRIDLADNVSLIAMSGEMCCEFGHFIKRNKPEKYVLPIGYSNGLIGYICPTRHYAEGGYEPYESTVYLGMPAPFRPDSEDLICAALTSLLAD